MNGINFRVRLYKFVIRGIAFSGWLAFVSVTFSYAAGLQPIFNGENLSGWHNVIGAEHTWHVEDQAIIASGEPLCVLRTDKQYENYTLELDYYAPSSGMRTAGLIVHADALPAEGLPWPRGINIQFENSSDSSRISAIGGAWVEPVTTVEKSIEPNPKNGWHHCEIRSDDGSIVVKVDGKTVSQAYYARPRKGYIALKSAGEEVQFKNIQIQEAFSTKPASYETATESQDFKSLYNGETLSDKWEMKPGHRGHWTAQNWLVNYDGESEEKDKNLWSKHGYKDFILRADMRFIREAAPDSLPVVLPNGNEAKKDDGSTVMEVVPYAGDTGIYVRGSSKNQINMGDRFIGSGEIYGYRVDKRLPAEVRSALVPGIKANDPPGQWNRYIITVKADRISVELNGHMIIDNALLPGIAREGRLALQDDHAHGNRFQFANLYIKELK